MTRATPAPSEAAAGRVAEREFARPAPADRRESSPDYREYVHQRTLQVARECDGDWGAAAEQAEAHAQAHPSRHARDVATLARRRATTLTDGVMTR